LQPAVILLDTLLPDMTAKEVTEHILHTNPTAKILLFAESYNELAVTEALAAGAVAAVEKSVAATLFVEMVSHLLEQQRLNDPWEGRN
jgi:DNA-binding NarL/FixJ family response regulator